MVKICGIYVEAVAVQTLWAHWHCAVTLLSQLTDTWVKPRLDRTGMENWGDGVPTPWQWHAAHHRQVRMPPNKALWAEVGVDDWRAEWKSESGTSCGDSVHVAGAQSPRDTTLGATDNTYTWAPQVPQDRTPNCIFITPRWFWSSGRHKNWRGRRMKVWKGPILLLACPQPMCLGHVFCG